MRIMIANEPRAYREVLEQTIAALRPHFSVTAVEPADLDAEITGRQPHLVICSHLSDAVRAQAYTWIMLYPAEGPQVIVSLAGTEITKPDLELAQLLSIIDETEEFLAQNS